MPELAEKEHFLELYAAGAEVLTEEGPFVSSSVRLLGQLTTDPTDELLLPLAADAATESNSPATSAIDVLPYIQRAVDPLTPKQTDPSQAQNVHWTLDWRAITKN